MGIRHVDPELLDLFRVDRRLREAQRTPHIQTWRKPVEPVPAPHTIEFNLTSAQLEALRFRKRKER